MYIYNKRGGSVANCEVIAEVARIYLDVLDRYNHNMKTMILSLKKLKQKSLSGA